MIGKLSQEVMVEDYVSHVSHRRVKNACGVGVNYVKKVSRCAWGKGFENASDAQGEKGWQRLWKEAGVRARTQDEAWRRFPARVFRGLHSHSSKRRGDKRVACIGLGY
jgi:hypothetical protein